MTNSASKKTATTESANKEIIMTNSASEETATAESANKEIIMTNSASKETATAESANKEIVMTNSAGNETVTAESANKGRTPAAPDVVIKDLGGCGRYQVRLSVTIHLVKTIFCFSFTNLIIITFVPTWCCEENKFKNVSCGESSSFQTCSTINSTKCQSFLFEEGTTSLVSEFKLICEYDFIPSTINSLQLAGTLTGNVISGHLADRFGRKPPFLIAILLVLVFNLVGFFSTSWEIFAMSTFFTGFGHGCFITTQYSIMSEYTPTKWRTLVIGFPSLALQQCFLSLLAWLIGDWRYLLLMTSLMAVPCLFVSYLVVPESFRWYLAHNKPEKAKHIITSIEKYNRHYGFNTDVDIQRTEPQCRKKYSFLHLFQTRSLLKITLLSVLNWIALGVVGFGMSFGIQTLSGNLYLNLFLFSLTSIPSRTIAMWLSNRLFNIVLYNTGIYLDEYPAEKIILDEPLGESNMVFPAGIGRRKTSSICFIVVGIAGLAGGILQTIDAKYKDQLTNVLAIIANTSIGAAWGTVQTMTIELYPTVIRNIGFGMLSFIGGIGSVIAPQLVYLNTYVPGLLLYVCGAISAVCVIGTLLLPETKDKYLLDKIIDVKLPINTVSNDIRPELTEVNPVEVSIANSQCTKKSI